MKLTFKTLQQKQFQLDVDEASSVADVKKKIEETQGHPVATQKLIFSGKILADDNTVASYNIGEKDFLVVMVSKPKVTKASTSSAPATPSKAETPEQPKTSEPEKVVTTETPPATGASTAAAATAETTTTTTTTEESKSLNASDALVTGQQYEEAIQNMMEMGFPRDQVIKAMRASFNNPDRAVDYLFSGIPEHLLQEQSSAEHESAEQEGDNNAPVADTDMGDDTPQNLFAAAAQQSQQQQQGGGGSDLSFLRSNEQFQQLRQLVQANPNLLQPLLQQVGQTNPELLRIINNDPQAFLQMLAEGGDDDDEGTTAPAGSQVIQVTQEEKEAIDRLEGLGFDRASVIEAYFACDKNEELAANFLFDQGNDDY
ncbi:XPC-binding domain-containing protein [Umbelopsis sp. AD052]|nr:XPC-binding domain-containing protein [Umbelopsis sp. AD052]